MHIPFASIPASINPGVKEYHGASAMIEDQNGNFIFQRRPADKKFPSELAFF